MAQLGDLIVTGVGRFLNTIKGTIENTEQIHLTPTTHTTSNYWYGAIPFSSKDNTDERYDSFEINPNYLGYNPKRNILSVGGVQAAASNDGNNNLFYENVMTQNSFYQKTAIHDITSSLTITYPQSSAAHPASSNNGVYVAENYIGLMEIEVVLQISGQITQNTPLVSIDGLGNNRMPNDAITTNNRYGVLGMFTSYQNSNNFIPMYWAKSNNVLYLITLTASIPNNSILVVRDSWMHNPSFTFM